MLLPAYNKQDRLAVRVMADTFHCSSIGVWAKCVDGWLVVKSIEEGQAAVWFRLLSSVGHIIQKLTPFMVNKDNMKVQQNVFVGKKQT